MPNTVLSKGTNRRPLFLIWDTLLAVCISFALAMDMNVRSGNNYVNWYASLLETPAVPVLFAFALFALRRARASLPGLGKACFALSLFLGAWWVMAQSVRVTQDVRQPFLSSSQLLKAGVTALGMAGVYGLLFRALAYALGRDWKGFDALRGGRLLALYRRHTGLFCAAVVLLCWLPYLFLGYPATASNDTLNQFQQILGELPLSKHHPLLGTLLIAAAVRLGGLLGSGNAGLFAYVLMQGLFAASVLGDAQALMRRMGAPRWLRVLSLFSCALMPVYGGNIPALLKDVPYSYAVLLLLCELVRSVYLADEAYRCSAGHVLRFALAGFLMLGMRNNGMLIFIPACVLMLTQIRRSKQRLLPSVLCATLPLLLLFAFDASANALLAPQPVNTRETLSLPFQQTARFAAKHGDSIAQDEREAIDRVLDYESLSRNYNPVLSDPVKATFKLEADGRDMAGYLAVWFKQFLRDPLCYAEATFIQNALLFDPQTENLCLFTDTGLDEATAAALDVSRPAFLQRLSDQSRQLRAMLLTLPMIAQLNSLGFHCIVMLFVGLIAIRSRVKGMLLVLVPQLGTALSIVLGPCIQNQDRYGFPIVYTMPLVLACLAYGLNKSKNG